MNILWLGACPHPIRDRADRHPVPWFTILANELMARPGVRLTIVSYSSDIEQDESFTHAGISYVFLKVPVEKWDLFTAFNRRISRVHAYLAKIEDQFDVLHIHGSEQQYQVIGARLKLPKVLSVQGIISEYVRALPKRPDYRHLAWGIASFYERKYLPAISHFICRTHWDTAHTKRMHPDAVVHQNWEPIRPEFFQSIAIRTEPTNGLLCVGGTNLIKGIREALIAYNLLCETLPFRLIIAGSGNREQILQLIIALKLTNIQIQNVEHRGFLTGKELRSTYNDAFCLIHPSYIDNSPNSVCEAQVAGLPVVASNVGGVSSLIKSEETGLLTSLDPVSIVDAVLKLWRNPTLYRLIAKQSRTVALTRHNTTTIVDNTLAIYQQVIADRKVPFKREAHV